MPKKLGVPKGEWKEHEISERVIPLSEYEGLIGKARIEKPFVLKTLKKGREFVCDDPLGLLFEAKGETEAEAIDAYLQHAADEFVVLSTGENVQAYAKHVRSKLGEHLIYFRWAPEADEDDTPRCGSRE